MGRAQLAKLLVTKGLRCLFPRSAFRTLQRNNWTGSDKDVDEIALLSFVFNLFPEAYLRAVASGASAVTLPVPIGHLEAIEGPALSRIEENLFQEDETVRQESVKMWMLYGRFHNDLFIVRRHQTTSMSWLLKQLDMSGITWERRQQIQFAKTGRRA